jgi:hypothetical protein
MIEMKRLNRGIDHDLYLQSHVPHPACPSDTEIDEEVAKSNFRSESGM